jgi:S1-C subfamily serine protease
MKQMISQYKLTSAVVLSTFVLSAPWAFANPHTIANIAREDSSTHHHHVSISPEEETNIRVYKETNQGVVHVATVAAPEDFVFNVMPKEGFGSGSIITPDGYILTNNHVVAGAKHLRVTLYDGTSVPADVIGTDPANDLAVIKITPPNGMKLTSIPMGDSADLEVGRRVLAIGNPFGLDRTLTQGIVSSIGRTLSTGNGRLIKGIIQTDAAINPGNSGGPLLDTSGHIVGINTAILSQAGQSAGIGFAIPVNIAKRLVPELIAHHHITRPDLGIEAVQQTDIGLRVVKLAADGPAAIAGIKGPQIVRRQQGPWTFQSVDYSQADIVVSVDNMKVKNSDDLLSYIDSKQAGQTVTLGVIRQGKLVKIPVKLGSDTNAV